MKKNCCFQLYVNGRVTDSGPITKKDGLAMLAKHQREFVDACKRGELAEMVLWINMIDEASFCETHTHLHSDDIIVRDGEIYELKQISF